MKKIYKLFGFLFVLFATSAEAQTTYTFNYTGAVQTWTVPVGVTSVVVNAVGASGGLDAQTIPGCTTTCGNMADSPGAGGCVVCTLAVTPGVVLDIYVGGGGANATTSTGGAGGFNGGGSGSLGYVPYAGGGGGGASDVRVPPYALANRVVVAGGGGGAGGNYFLPAINDDKGGDGGGLTGQAGSDGGIMGGAGAGGGGTPSSGGSFGTYSGWGSGTAGTLGIGGTAGSPSGGGGGGGGYYGGGGASWAGGGGGSSYTDATLATGVTHTQGCSHNPDGYVKITVLCTPPIGGAIVGPSVLCSGDPATYTDPTGSSGGTWSSSNPSAASIGSATGVLTSTPAGGVTTITYSISVSCGSASVTQTITINPAPAAITGAANLCTGSTVTLSDATPLGVWTSSNPGVATVDSFSGVVTGVSVGATTISYILPTGCYVTAALNVVGIIGPHEVCEGSSVTLSATSTGGTWSSGSPLIASIGSAGVVTGANVGVTAISYTLPLGCTALWSFTVNPVAPILGPDSVCLGSFTYETNIVGGGTWSSVYTSVATILPDSGKIYGLLPGIDTVIYLLPTGCESRRPFTVIAYPGPIISPGQVCVNSTTGLSNGTPGGSWSSMNTGVATVNPSSGEVTGVFADTVDIVYTIPPGCSVSTRMLVNPLPAPITGPAVICPGVSDTMFDVTPGGLWSSSVLSVATIVDTNGHFTTINGGTTLIKYQLPTTCMQTKLLSVDPIPVPNITYNYLLNTFFATPGYATYQWYDSAVGKIPGATSPTLAAPETQYYWVEVTDANGCKGKSAYYHFDIRSVGVKNYVNTADIRIYPNPTSSVLYISSPVKVRASITTVDGRQEIDQKDAHSIDVSMLPAGMYMITLFDEEGTRIAVQKWVKD